VRPCLENTHHKKNGLVEWLKVKALNSSPSTAKNKKKFKKQENRKYGICSFPCIFLK
jgi:hypothetical protein